MADALPKQKLTPTEDCALQIGETRACPADPTRMTVLNMLQILDTEPEDRFDAIVRMAATQLQADVASIDFVDTTRVWSKSMWNARLREFPRTGSFAEQIAESGQMLVVRDMQARERPRGFYRPDLVTQTRFFVGVPIRCSNGIALGAICVACCEPRTQLQPEDLLALENLASLVTDQLELRHLRQRQAQPVEQERIEAVESGPVPVEASAEAAAWPTAEGLQYALEQDQFVLHYQPEVEIATGRIVGLEALIRWRHPQRGLLAPQSFIPQAEDNGMILPIGDWGLATACRQLQAWKQNRPWLEQLRVCVNLSARQFTRNGLADHIQSLLMTTGLRGHHLGLEMTESTLIPSITSTLGVLNSLQRLGVSLHMDDFGTGYSSLSHLHRFPFDVLKVDRSFVKRMTMGAQPLQIVKTILELARVLGMDVVAEGIETHEQRALLEKLGCHYGQGYLFSPPLDAESMEKLLATPETRIGFARQDSAMGMAAS